MIRIQEWEDSIISSQYYNCYNDSSQSLNTQTMGLTVRKLNLLTLSVYMICYAYQFYSIVKQIWIDFIYYHSPIIIWD